MKIRFDNENSINLNSNITLRKVLLTFENFVLNQEIEKGFEILQILINRNLTEVFH